MQCIQERIAERECRDARGRWFWRRTSRRRSTRSRTRASAAGATLCPLDGSCCSASPGRGSTDCSGRARAPDIGHADGRRPQSSGSAPGPPRIMLKYDTFASAHAAAREQYNYNYKIELCTYVYS